MLINSCHEERAAKRYFFWIFYTFFSDFTVPPYLIISHLDVQWNLGYLPQHKKSQILCPASSTTPPPSTKSPNENKNTETNKIIFLKKKERELRYVSKCHPPTEPQQCWSSAGKASLFIEVCFFPNGQDHFSTKTLRAIQEQLVTLDQKFNPGNESNGRRGSKWYRFLVMK